MTRLISNRIVKIFTKAEELKLIQLNISYMNPNTQCTPIDIIICLTNKLFICCFIYSL